MKASAKLDQELTGANPIDVLIEFPPGQTLYSPESLDVLAEVNATVEKQAGLGNVWSLQTLRTWLAERAGDDSVATLERYVGYLPKYLVRRFISEKQDAELVSARIPDKDASQLLPVIDDLDASLNAVRTKYPGYEVAVTGLAVIAARNSADMIDKLNRGLTLEFLLVAVFIGLAFRSVIVALAAILPGIFPVVASGSLLLLLGEGLQFVSVVALTVSFGLGLSATIHFLEPAAAGGGSRRGSEAWGRTRHDPDGAGADPDVGRARLRPRRHGLLRPAVAAAVRMAQRLRHAGGADGRFPDPAADDDVPARDRSPSRSACGTGCRGIDAATRVVFRRGAARC